jgi:hypothetical protein
MSLKIRKLAISTVFLFSVSLITALFYRGTIFASDGISGANNISSTIIDNLSFRGHFTLSPDDPGVKNLGKNISISKAYRIDNGENIYGEVLFSENSDPDSRSSARLMISHISRNYPFITRNQFREGENTDKISYHEWGRAKSDIDEINYQNLIVKEGKFTWYIIILYRDGYGNDVERIIKSINFTI